jgi:pseudouridine-5'-phosphate glycosidase
MQPLPSLPYPIHLSPEVSRALELDLPLVALESAVITHGLPFPENLTLAENMEREVSRLGATPATVAVMEGRIHIGLSSDAIQRLASREKLLKISTRDFGPAIALGASGGTTVAATMLAAHSAGLQVFATGGIGGVHYDISGRRQGIPDVSADLPALANIPLIVVCAGAKAILDLPATIEYLETWGVPVVGYGTDNFPAFYCRECGLKTSARAESPAQVVEIARAHWALGMRSAVLLVVPPPEQTALPLQVVEKAVLQALGDAQAAKLRGQNVTPFLLNRVAELTGGESRRANISLLLNNAQVAAEVARQMAVHKPISRGELQAGSL